MNQILRVVVVIVSSSLVSPEWEPIEVDEDDALTETERLGI